MFYQDNCIEQLNMHFNGLLTLRFRIMECITFGQDLSGGQTCKCRAYNVDDNANVIFVRERIQAVLDFILQY